MEQEFKGRIELTHGCISQDERLTSRDMDNPAYFETEQQARARLQEHSDFYRSIGYKIWFSHIRKWDPKTRTYEEIEAPKVPERKERVDKRSSRIDSGLSIQIQHLF